MKRVELRELRKKDSFFCPQCGGDVLLKVGEIVTPHFAHKQNTTCSQMFSEGESSDHLLGKQQLYQFLQEARQNVLLEPYFKTLAQRPDLLVTNGTDKIPIEFQCSSIPISQIELRTAGYKSIGMNPLWIIKTPNKLKTLPQGVGKFQLSQFEKAFFISDLPEGVVLLTYNPQLEQFHYFYRLLHIIGNQYIGIHRILPISNQVFPLARPKIPGNQELKRFVWIYLTTRRKFLQSRILLSRKGINDPFLRRCYELKINPSELPSWIGVPNKFSISFQEHVCEWQLAFVYYMTEEYGGFHKLTDKAVWNFVKRFRGNTRNQVHACIEYLNFLLSIGITALNGNAKVVEEQQVSRQAFKYLAKWHEN